MKNKKILVTGATGFIGSHLTELLVAEGYDVRAFVHYNSKNNWGWLESSPVIDEIDVYTGDVRDYDSVFASMAGCGSVFHLAALIGIPYSYVSPQAYIQTNIQGTYNVLQAARMQDFENVIVTSTSEVYGTAQYTPIDENHPIKGQSPYSATKIAADQLAYSYYASFGLPVRIVRPFNTYGPRQSARAIIPTIITQLKSGKKQIKLGNLAPTRDLTFVQDTVRGFLAIAKSNCLGQVINIGMNEETSIGDLAKLIMDVLNVKAEIVSDGERIRPEKSEVERLWCNNHKIISDTEWRPQYDLERGLKETAIWLQEHLKQYKTGVYNV